MPLTVRANLATQWQGFNGNVTAPMYSFSSAPGSGMFHAGTGNVGMSINGTEVAQVTTNSLVLNGSLVTPLPTMFKNVLINGDMCIMQRGPPAANIGGSNATAYTLDRWFVSGGGTANNQISQVLSELSGFQYAVRCQRPSGVTNINNIIIGQSLETIATVPLQGKTMTLSYYIRAGNTLNGTVTAYVGSGTGVDQAPGIQLTSLAWTGQSQIVNATITPSTSWTRYTHTFQVPSNSQELVICFVKTNTGTAGANDSFDVTGVQLEHGAVATTFEQRPFATELALCQRYYTKSYNTNTPPGSLTENGVLAVVTPGTNAVWTPVFKQTMRQTPTILVYAPNTGAQGNCNEIQASTNYAVNIYTIGTQGFYAYTGSLPARTISSLIHYTADAEISTIIVTSNMILYLDAANSTSYPGSGSTWYDLMLLSNATQSATGVTFVPNEPRYFSYNGSTGYHDMTMTNTAGAWAHTISFWFQINTATTQCVPFMTSGALNSLYLNYPSANQHTWSFNSNDLYFPYTLVANRWYHICLTYNGGIANTTNKLAYVNGVNVGMVVVTGGTTALNITANSGMQIGRRTSGDLYFPGKIGEFIVYNGALTAAQALQNFTARRSYYGV